MFGLDEEGPICKRSTTEAPALAPSKARTQKLETRRGMEKKSEHRRIDANFAVEEERHGRGPEPVIIGGMVLDIHAIPSIPANPKTTTPGKVHYTLGGVARNVAECVSKLGIKPYMISAVGHDMAGNLLLEHWRSSGLAIEGIRKSPDNSTPVVCNIFDSEGELAAAVASVEAVEQFVTAEWIKKFVCNILRAPVLMVDANLNPSALQASCQLAANSDVPVWFEPVSVAKSRRVAPVAK